VDGRETGEQHEAMLRCSHAAVGSASGRTCQTALHFRQWQTVMVFRTVACTSVEPHTGHVLQMPGMAASIAEVAGRSGCFCLTPPLASG
jgi:hypothetical protein